MTQEFLAGTNGVAAFEQVGGERVPEGVKRNMLRQPRPYDRLRDRLLNERLV